MKLPEKCPYCGSTKVKERYNRLIFRDDIPNESGHLQFDCYYTVTYDFQKNRLDETKMCYRHPSYEELYQKKLKLCNKLKDMIREADLDDRYFKDHALRKIQSIIETVESSRPRHILGEVDEG